jgi:arylsulfatase A-like enzyme
MDLTATILAATGTSVPPEARHDGTNLLPVLEGRTPPIERTLFWRVLGNSPQQAVRSGDWKFVRDGGRLLLFDLRRDVGERENVLPQHPEIARRLQGALTAWQEDVDSEAKRQATSARQ